MCKKNHEKLLHGFCKASHLKKWKVKKSNGENSRDSSIGLHGVII